MSDSIAGDPKDPEVRIKRLIDADTFQFLLPRTD